MTDPKVTGLRDIIKDNANSGGQNMQNAINGNKMIQNDEVITDEEKQK